MLYDVPMVPPAFEPLLRPFGDFGGQAQLRQLVSAFLEENAKVNLSAFRTEEQCWIGNVLDSLAALELPQVTEAKTILDLGTGGGFPLLPLAITLPGTQCTGLDSVQKKTDAVGRIAASLDLPNVRLVTGRAEEFGRNTEYREQFDVVTSRAVAELNVLLEFAAPFVKPQGHIVLWKSVTIERELQDSLLARAELSTHLIKQHVYDLGETWGKRQLLVFQKTAPLSGKYPREVGVPGKKPLE